MDAKNVLLLLLVVFMLTATTHAGIPITVENYSFELPGTGKIQTDWSRVPGWDSDGLPVDSGVEDYEGAATDGTWTAFLMGTDPSIYNLTEHVIDSGQAFLLKFDAGTPTDCLAIPAM